MPDYPTYGYHYTQSTVSGNTDNFSRNELYEATGTASGMYMNDNATNTCAQHLQQVNPWQTGGYSAENYSWRIGHFYQDVPQYQGIHSIDNCCFQDGRIVRYGQISFDVRAKVDVVVSEIPGYIGLVTVVNANGKVYTHKQALTYDEFVIGVDISVIVKMKAEVIESMKADNLEVWQAWAESGQAEDTWLVWNIDATEVGLLRSARSVEEYQIDKAIREKALIEAEEKRQQEVELRQQRRDKASEKAKQLLKEVIGEVDFSEYQKTGVVTITTKSGRQYKLRKDAFARNIDVYEKGAYKHRLCAHLADQDIPIEDNLVAQVLMLRHAEADFLRMANVS